MSLFEVDISSNLQQKVKSQQHVVIDQCNIHHLVKLPNLIDNGPTIRPAIFIYLPTVCNDVAFKHGGLCCISLYISSEMTLTMAAVSTTAFIALLWSVMGVIKDDGREIWQTVKSPVVFLPAHFSGLLKTHG